MYKIYIMVDRYYRKIEDVENDIENAMQISSILLKLKGYDNDLSKIDTNENNISSNLGKIGDNENNISSNLSKIGDNINAIKLVNKNSQDNRKDISSNLSKINDNEKSISTNLEKIDNFTQYILQSGKDFEEKYTIEKQIFNFNKNKHFYTIFEKEIEFEFTKNSLLFVKNHMYYKYENLSNDYHRLQHEYNIYDGDNLIHKYLFNKDTYYDESLNPILHTNEDFCICFKKNYNKIKINLQLHRHNRHGVGNINLEIDDDNESYINIDYLDRNNEQVDTNTRDISSNLGKINDISSNLAQINTNTNTISSNSGQISTNTLNISDNLEKINHIKYNLPTSEIFKKTYSIANQSFQFTKNIVYFKLSEIEIENNFKINGILEFDNYIYYRYDNLQLDHHRLQHEYRILDDKNNLLYKKILNKTNTSDLDFDNNIMLVKDNFYFTFKNNYNKIKIIFDLYRVYRHGAGNFNLELINESFVNITYLDKNNISLKIDTNTRDISSNLGKINTNDISSNLGKIDDNINAIKLINKNSQDNSKGISNNKGLISTNTSSISTNLSKINNITKTIMLKNIYFTDFDSKKDEPIIKELIRLDKNTSRDRTKEILKTNLEYYFKKDDFIEIDCKLMIQHSTYNYADIIFITYSLYDGEIDPNKGLYREIRRYNQFPVMNAKNRILAYTKLCYKFKHDVNNITILINISSATKKIDLVLHHYIVEYGTNYISVKHYGKS